MTQSAPRWEKVLAIADGLLGDGACVLEVAQPWTRACEDLDRDLREVERIFRLKTVVHRSEAADPYDPTVTVIITHEVGQEIRVNRSVNLGAGLKALLRAVEESRA